VLYTSLQTVTYPLVLDTAFFHDGARLVNVSIHDTFWTNAVGRIFPPPFSRRPLKIQGLVCFSLYDVVM
jgi:hypothetical protein